jgi:hypothetical protein
VGGWVGGWVGVRACVFSGAGFDCEYGLEEPGAESIRALRASQGSYSACNCRSSACACCHSYYRHSTYSRVKKKWRLKPYRLPPESSHVALPFFLPKIPLSLRRGVKRNFKRPVFLRTKIQQKKINDSCSQTRRHPTLDIGWDVS